MSVMWSFEPILEVSFRLRRQQQLILKDSVYDTFGFTVNVANLGPKSNWQKNWHPISKSQICVHTLDVSEIQKSSGHCQLVPYICVEKAVQNCCRKWESVPLEIWRIRIRQ